MYFITYYFILVVSTLLDWKNSNDQAYSCPRDWRFSAITCAQLKIFPMKPFKNHTTMVLRGLRGGRNCTPNMTRVAKMEAQDFAACVEHVAVKVTLPVEALWRKFWARIIDTILTQVSKLYYKNLGSIYYIVWKLSDFQNHKNFVSFYYLNFWLQVKLQILMVSSKRSRSDLLESTLFWIEKEIFIYKNNI